MIRGSHRVPFFASLFAVVGVLVVPLAVLAHAHLRRSEPAARERLAVAPRAIRLWFSERPQLAFTRVRLRGADSSEITLGPVAAIERDALGVVTPVLTTLPGGAYTVLWQTGGADGHPMRGSFGFTVVGGAERPPTTTPGLEASVGSRAATDSVPRRPDGHSLVRVQRTAEPEPLNAYVAARWVEFIGILAVIGAVVLRLIALRAAGAATDAARLDHEMVASISDAARRFALGAIVLTLGGALARLYGEAALMLGAGATVDGAALARILRETVWGAGWTVGAIGSVIAATGLLAARRAAAGWWVAGAGAVTLATGPALTGHAAATAPLPLSLAADILHVLGAGIWLGTLLVLLIAAVPATRRRVAHGAQVAAILVRAFHPPALIGAAVVLTSGVIASWLRLPAVSSLWDSLYGRVLLLKIGFVLSIVVLGAVNWRRLLPVVGDERGARSFRRTAGAELVLTAFVLLVTALLGALSPPEAAIEQTASSVGAVGEAHVSHPLNPTTQGRR